MTGGRAGLKRAILRTGTGNPVRWQNKQEVVL